jgi:hypothetical protein
MYIAYSIKKESVHENNTDKHLYKQFPHKKSMLENNVNN